MPLILAPVGEENIIKKIGGKQEVKAHLEALGFVVGAAVTIVSAMGEMSLSMSSNPALPSAEKWRRKSWSEFRRNEMKTLREAKIGDSVRW